MNTPQQVTRAIVLTRTNFGEADRIITLLTPDYGKLCLIAKGVRRVKSKLAGGIELFSVTDITFVQGRGDIGRLASARLRTHYGRIVRDVHRTMLGYELLRQLHTVTEDEPEPEYFSVLEQAFAALDDATIELTLIRFWFGAQLLRLTGHTPNVRTARTGEKLQAGQTYEFSFDDSCFIAHPDAPYDANIIKFLRLALAGNPPHVLAKVQGSGGLATAGLAIITSLCQVHLRLG